MKSATEIEALIRSFLMRNVIGGTMEELSLESNLFAEGYVDSIGIMKLIAHIESGLELKIPPKDLVPKNFMTIQSMVSYLETRQ